MTSKNVERINTLADERLKHLDFISADDPQRANPFLLQQSSLREFLTDQGRCRGPERDRLTSHDHRQNVSELRSHCAVEAVMAPAEVVNTVVQLLRLLEYDLSQVVLDMRLWRPVARN